MSKLKDRFTAPIKSIYLNAVLLVILLSVYMFADIDKYVPPLFAAKQSTPQSTPPQPIMSDLSRPTSTGTANIATAVSTTDITSAASTSIIEKKMTRDEVCEFLMETDGDPESERITPDKIEEAKNAVPSLIDYMQNGEDGFCAGLAMDVLGRTKDKRAYI